LVQKLPAGQALRMTILTLVSVNLDRGLYWNANEI
jgi:hypothetical protein